MAGTRSSSTAWSPVRRRAAEVGRVPGGHLAGPRPVVRQLLQALEQVGQQVAELEGALGEVVTRSDVHRGAEGEVDAPAPGPVDRRRGVADGEDPLGAPDADGYDGRAGLARQGDQAAHQRPHGVGEGDAGLGEAADRLPCAQEPPGAEVRVGRRLPVHRDVLHPVHEPRDERHLPHVVAGHEPHVAAPRHRSLLDEDEVGIGHVRRGQHRGPVRRQVLDPAPAHVHVEGAQSGPADPLTNR